MKKFGCILVLILLTVFFIISPQNAFEASQDGLDLWFTQILPALLPFSVLSYVILHSHLLAELPIRSHRISAGEWYIIVCGFLFGFPIGCKLTADLYHEGLLSKKRAEILCCFTNNLSPVFVVTALSRQLQIRMDVRICFLLYGIPLLYGLCALLICQDRSDIQKNTASRFQMDMQIIDAGIINGFETLIKICGYIMMFSIITKMLLCLPMHSQYIAILLTGCLEVTNGIRFLAQSDLTAGLKYIIALGILSANGICGLFQSASILSRTDLSVKRYCMQKALLVVLSVTTAILLFLSVGFC